jgi:MFS family permease
VNNYLGRRGAIFVSGIFVLLTPIGGAFAQTWEQLLITRLLMGIGMGLKGSSVPIFVSIFSRCFCDLLILRARLLRMLLPLFVVPSS